MDTPELGSCPFCTDFAAGRGVVSEAGPFFFRWDRYPVSEGHLLVIPKRHVTTLAELSTAEGRDLWTAMIQGIETARGHAKADGFNIGVNQGRAAGQTVAHLHLHIIPRHNGDVPDARGGVRGVIPGKRCYESDAPR